MRRLWMQFRMPLAVLAILVMTVGLARLFSGSEDDWIKNDRGEWVAHGKPSGPPPSGEEKKLPVERVLPWVFLVSFAAPLFFLGMYRHSNKLTYETSLRDMRFFGYTGSALVLLGTLTVIGIGGVMIAADTGGPPARTVDLLFLGLLAGWAGLCILLGAVMFLFRRMANDHFQIERGRREILEAMELLRGESRN
jgi:hypothetical protein